MTSSICNVLSDEHVLYGNVFKSVSGVQGTYIERQLQFLKRFPYIFAMFHGRFVATKTS